MQNFLVFGSVFCFRCTRLLYIICSLHSKGPANSCVLRLGKHATQYRNFTLMANLLSRKSVITSFNSCKTIDYDFMTLTHRPIMFISFFDSSAYQERLTGRAMC